jgi:hypothetical protein
MRKMLFFIWQFENIYIFSVNIQIIPLYLLTIFPKSPKIPERILNIL